LLDNVSDFRLSTRTIILNPLLRFLYWHMNFHIEHHKYAAVPCYRLGTLHRLIRHDLPPSPRGLLAAPAMTGRLL
jgi:fatty acid desaturase